MNRAKQNFLNHLAGLRGLAIILVVLFHLDANTWAHGYLGVDVFLVITGYLLLRGRLQRGGVESLPDTARYLGRRFQRIVPSTAVLIIIVLLLGILILHPGDEIFIGKLSYRTCQLKGNSYLALKMADYFGASTAFNPLLHTWYISVILQIYLLYAAANQLLQRLRRGWIIGILALVGVASLIWAQCRDASYYATLPRLWEVLAGGLVCLLPSLSKRRGWATAVSGVGLLCILLPAVFGILPYTALAVAGAVLALRYLPESHIEKSLSNAPLRWLGGISFSLYLVHMPLFIFWRIMLLGEMSVADELIALALSLPLGWLFWWCIEKRRTAWWGVVLLWVAALLLSRSVYQMGRGYLADITRVIEQYLTVPTYDNAPYPHWALRDTGTLQAELSPYFRANRAVFGYMHQIPPQPNPLFLSLGDATQPITTMLIGDSHAMCLYPGLDAVLRQEHVGGLYMTSVVIPLTDHNIYQGEDYFYTPEKAQVLLRVLAAHPEITHIIIAQRWWPRCKMVGVQTFEQKLQDFLTILHRVGKKIILIPPYPEYPQDSPVHYQRAAMLRGLSIDELSPTCTQEQYLEIHGAIFPVIRRLEAQGLCTMPDLLQSMQPGEAFHASEGKTLYMDDSNHLNPEGALWIMHRILPQLRPLLKPATAPNPS